MRSTHEFKVGDRSFSVTHFSSTKSLDVLFELAKIVGEPLANLASDGDNVMDMDVGKVLPNVVSSLFKNMKTKETVQLIKSILESVTENGQLVMVDFDVRFAGQIDVIFTVLVESLKHQYGSLKNVVGVISKLRGMN